MSRILLADDSPHAQRMGEFILREEGFEVVSVTDGETAVLRRADVDPDLILADVSLPQRNGYQVCDYVKTQPRFRHTRVVLTAGAQEPFDEEEARRVQADASVRKPFEATAVLEIVKPLVAAAQLSRSAMVEEPTPVVAPAEIGLDSPPAPDAGLVRAAVTLALEAALPVLVAEITARVLAALERDSA